jgi:hypothetical protein
MLQLIVFIVFVGLVLWLVNQYIPMDPKVKQILNVVVIIALVLWLLGIFVGYGPVGSLGGCPPFFHR